MSTVYNHRPMQSIMARPNPSSGCSAPPPSFNVGGSLDLIKQEYEALQSQVRNARHQRDDMESKLDAQVAELNSIRRALFELEDQHIRVRQHYQSELQKIRGGGFGSKGSYPGIPGHSPLPSGSPSISQSYPLVSRSQHRQLSQEAGDNQLTQAKTRPREEETERLGDPRDPKRHKTKREQQDVQTPSTASNTGANEVGLRRAPSSTVGPPFGIPKITASTEKILVAVEQLMATLQNAPPYCRKERGEWTIQYNPKVRKAVDLNLVHSFYHATVVCCVQFSLDGRFLATGCNKTTQIYDVQSGNKLCILVDETAPQVGDLYIRSVKFSPDGKLLATGAEDHKIRVWDIAKHRIKYVFDGHTSEIYSLDFSCDGRYIVSGSGDGTMRIWNLSDQSYQKITIETNKDDPEDTGVTSVAISPDGTLVAAGCLDSHVRIWDINTGALLELLKAHEDSVYSVAFTPDGKGLVSGSLDKTLRFWNITEVVNQFKAGTLKPLIPGVQPDRPLTASSLTFIGHKNFVLSASFTTDTRWVISGSKDRTIYFWDAQTADLQFMLQGHRNSVISLDVNPRGGLLATGSGDSTARIWTYSAI